MVRNRLTASVRNCRVHRGRDVACLNNIRQRVSLFSVNGKAERRRFPAQGFAVILCVCFILLNGCKSPPLVPEKAEVPVIEEKFPLPSTSDPEGPEELPYYLEKIPPPAELSIGLDPCSFTHYLYYRIFVYMNLLDVIPQNERVILLKEIYTLLQKGYQVNIVVRKYLGVGPMMVALYFVHEFGGPVLFLKTNYDEGAGVLVPMDIPKEEWYRCISSRYSIVGTKLVEKENFYSRKTEYDFKETEDMVGLARLYVYDEKDDNDEAVPDLLNNALLMKKDTWAGFNILLLLSHYYLLRQDMKESRLRMNQAYYVINNSVPPESELQKLYAVRRHELDVAGLLYRENTDNGVPK
ncbi:MAG: hypothetical protein JW881_09150 [Spirochaetales bacterium]|nr:hypothetical protein [Spirochaetales bacterium]